MITLKVSRQESKFPCDSCGEIDYQNEDIQIHFTQEKVKQAGCTNLFGTLCHTCRNFLISELETRNA